MNQQAKQDAGKLRLSLVPTQIIKDIAEVREYGNKKYDGDPENWRTVEMQRYIDAFYRHWLEFIKDPWSVDEESKIEHYKHCACNMAFICELMLEEKNSLDNQFLIDPSSPIGEALTNIGKLFAKRE